MSHDKLTILCVGDVVGKPGRHALAQLLLEVQRNHHIDVTIANIENAAGGHGVTVPVYQEIGRHNIQVFTSGNHIYDKHEIMSQMDKCPRLIRPLNYSQKAPGKGSYITNYNGIKIAVVNLIGRVFMNPTDCPFRAIEAHLEALKAEAQIVIVDFHAEATSEKQAMGWFLNGKVSLVYGTHTHVQTADEHILDKGTAYITDIGMTGASNGILGMQLDPILNRFLTGLPSKFDTPKNGPVQLNAVKLEVDVKTGKALSIARIFERQ